MTMTGVEYAETLAFQRWAIFSDRISVTSEKSFEVDPAAW